MSTESRIKLYERKLAWVTRRQAALWKREGALREILQHLYNDLHKERTTK